MSLLKPFTAVFSYFRGVRDEATKVTWPTQEETLRKTMIVIVTSVTVGLFIGAIDFVLTQITRFLIQ